MCNNGSITCWVIREAVLYAWPTISHLSISIVSLIWTSIKPTGWRSWPRSSHSSSIVLVLLLLFLMPLGGVLNILGRVVWSRRILPRFLMLLWILLLWSLHFWLRFTRASLNIVMLRCRILLIWCVVLPMVSRLCCAMEWMWLFALWWVTIRVWFPLVSAYIYCLWSSCIEPCWLLN